MFQTKISTGIENTYFMFYNFFFPENRSVYGITWKNTAQQDRTCIAI